MGKNKLHNKIRITKWLWIITIFALLIIIGGLFYIIFNFTDLFYGALNNKHSNIVKLIKKDKAPCEDCVRRKIDGAYVKKSEENIFPVSFIIENQVDARPQYGLSKANLVYEAEAEGGITRFLAFYASGEEIDKIGPIRSARPYFVDWAREMSSLFVHCGGSPEALVKISKENILDVNEFYNGRYFWRDKSVSAPHNIFSSSENINKYTESKNYIEGKFLPWNYKNDLEPEKRPDHSEININFKFPYYVVKWKYNKESNEYIRYMANKIHKDADGSEIKAKNIIIEYVEAKVIDEELRLKMEHIGGGEALVCLDGKCEEGEWRKKTNTSRTRFYKKPPLDKGGVGGFISEEFILNSGTTWIEVVRPEYEVIY